MVENERDEVVLVASGVIAPPRRKPAGRLRHVYDRFAATLDEWLPSMVLLERPGYWRRRGGSRGETLEALAMARACMLLAWFLRNIPALEIEVTVIRRTTMGRPNARPHEILRFLQAQRLQVPFRPRGAPDMDIANALLLAVYGHFVAP